MADFTPDVPPAPPEPVPEPMDVTEHVHEGRSWITVHRAPAVSIIEPMLFHILELAPNERARVVGDVLVMTASNGIFRYQVLRQTRVAYWDGTGRPVWKPFVMVRLPDPTPPSDHPR